MTAGQRLPAMGVHTPVMDHPKKTRRRRKNERQPLSATIIPDADLRGEEGLLSAHLYDQLFPWAEENDLSTNQVLYIAVAPWVPQPSGIHLDLSWTILPVKVPERPSPDFKETPPASTVRYPPTSPSLRAILGDTFPTWSTKNTAKAKNGTRVLVLDVQPVQLTNVYVTVDGKALQRHEQIQKEFGGGFGAFRQNVQVDKGKGKGTSIVRNGVQDVSESATKEQQEKELTDAVRSALGSSLIVRQDDLLPLPLPAHPITHVPLPPAKIILCEPVHQGLLSPDTKIIVNRQSNSSRRGYGRANGRPWSPSQATMGNGDDISNEQFFSAVEENMNGHSSQDEVDEAESNSSSPERDSGSESDESMDDIISLTSPSLTSERTDTVSSLAATPRAQGPAINGTSTPGSMFTGFTATTARQKNGRGKAFRVHELAAPVPTDLLHPRPSDDEDDESRVFADVHYLQGLKCFSGDWVALRAPLRDRGSQPESWDSNALHVDDEDDSFRVVRLYGLPNLLPRTRLRSAAKDLVSSQRRSSVPTSSEFKRPAPEIWMSPILHANLEHPAGVSVASLTSSQTAKQPFSPKGGSGKHERLGKPPIAAEMSLAKITTPIAQEAAMQEMLFSRVKRYFKSKRRIVKTGDVIAMTVDVNIGRMLGASHSPDETGQGMEELLSLLAEPHRSSTALMDVVWYKVGHITRPTPGKRLEDDEDDIWGGAVCVDPAITRMTIGTSHQCRIPPRSQNSWKSYLGLLPRTADARLASPMSTCMSTLPRPYTSQLQRRLRELMAAATSPRAMNIGIEPTLILLYSTQRNIGKGRTINEAASDLGLHTFPIDSYEIISEGNAGEVQESSFKARIARGLSCGAQYTTILIRHLEALTSNRMSNALQEASKSVRILIATTTQLDQVPENTRNLFTHEIEMSAPDEGERQGILQSIIQEQGVRIAHDVDLAAIAVKTAALVAGNLVDIVERAIIARENRLENLIQSAADCKATSQSLVRDLIVSGGEWARCVTKYDFDVAVDAARKNFADAIGAPKIPNVSWDDVGGLEHVKDAVMETIQLPLARPELFAKGMKKRSGILFYGPPGTGKTLLAKAIATEFSLNFFSVKGPELLNMYIGESEANVRRVFQRARDARPCVVFFDELDSVAPKRGNQGDSGGVMDRIVSQLLAELDGMSNGDDSGGGVFVIGATNRPDLLDQALLRPGRFDKMLYLGISDTHQKQLRILEALTRKFTFHPGFSLARFAESLPFTYTGADLYALCSDAMLKAITRQASAVDAKIKGLPGGRVSHAYFFEKLATKEDVAVVVTEEDFYAARRELVGSVRWEYLFAQWVCRTDFYCSAKELDHYQRVRQSFETPSKPPPPTTSLLPSAPMPTRPKPTKRTNTVIRSQPVDSKGKGKGKARQEIITNDVDSDSNDDDDDAYVTSNDSIHHSPEPKLRMKGKGKATMIPRPVDGFGDPSADDKEMYK
ncbi:MAG: hypothetical protein LQ338_004934 [Usnochroma carphineum]|nr:MAG: hypothetical protein LQ338_004934 [Usnochroma carphineum]